MFHPTLYIMHINTAFPWASSSVRGTDRLIAVISKLDVSADVDLSATDLCV